MPQSTCSGNRSVPLGLILPEVRLGETSGRVNAYLQRNPSIRTADLAEVGAVRH
jgi:hypothetical protein